MSATHDIDLSIEVAGYVLEKGQSVQNPASSKPHKTLHGPGFLIVSVRPSGLFFTEHDLVRDDPWSAKGVAEWWNEEWLREHAPIADLIPVT